MWRGGRAAVVQRRAAAAMRSSTSSTTSRSFPLLLLRRPPQERPSPLLLLRPATAAYTTQSSRYSHQRAGQGRGGGTGSTATATTATAALALLAATNAWGGEDGAARQDAGTFHARPPTRPHRVMYSIATYPGNEYIEDRHEIRELQGGDVFCGVFDGHGGWQVAEYASTHLSRNVEVELGNMGSLQGTDQVSKALVRAFERTDRGVIQKVHHAFEIGLGNVAKVGCCALAVLVRGHALYVANAGDCRAVLGKRPSAPRPPPPPTNNKGKGKAVVAMAAKEGAGAGEGYEAVALSDDHNAKLPKEMEELKRAHPGEADIVKCKHPNACYVKGRLQPTRALGDAYLKYPEFNGRPNRSDSSAGRYIPPPYTPPYITATPEVKVFPDALSDPRAEFVILASDGVWDLLTNEEAVRFVGQAVAEGDVAHVSQRLIAHALDVRAKDLGMTVEELRALPPGRPRRSKHDDMTCLVLLLHGPGSAAETAGTAAGTNPQDGIDVSIDPTLSPWR